MISPESALPIMKQLARECGAIIMKFFDSDELVEQTKSTEADIVTQADLLSDKHIREELAKHFPTAGMITEEGQNIEPKTTKNDKSDAIWFCCDPLDGTTNFSCGLPIFAVSIAMLDYKLESIAGVVYDPTRDEMFSAVKGKGSFLESPRGTKQLHCRNKSDLINCLIATGFNPNHVKTSKDNNMNELSKILPHVRCIRRCGSSALDACYVAAARLDGYWENGPHIWDIAASSLIATEAGAIVTDYMGQPLTKEAKLAPMINFVVAGKETNERLVSLIKEARAETQ